MSGSYFCELCKAPHDFTSLANIESGFDCRRYRASLIPEGEQGRGSKDDPKHDEWQAEVVKMAASVDSVLWYHTYRSEKCEPGYPDVHILMLGQCRSIFVECKVGTDKPSKDQLKWVHHLKRCDHEAYVLYPADADRWAGIVTRKPE